MIVRINAAVNIPVLVAPATPKIGMKPSLSQLRGSTCCAGKGPRTRIPGRASARDGGEHFNQEPVTPRAPEGASSLSQARWHASGVAMRSASRELIAVP
jgi:hypothetical protein